jgi:AraC-like DNA-binding protein
MAFSLAPLDFDPRERTPLLDGVREQVRALAPTDGHRSLLFPDVCLYRFSTPSTFRKAAAFGVTLGVVLAGEKRVRVGGHDLDVNPSQLLVVTRESDLDIAVTRASPQAPYFGLHVCFGPDRVARALLRLAEAGGNAAGEAPAAFVFPPPERIVNALGRLVASLTDPVEAKLLAPLAIDEILFLLLRTDAAATIRSGVGRPVDAERILQAMQFIRAHHAEKLNVERLAKHAGMSASHFAHRFRSVARVSPMRYLREVRLDRARSLLLEKGTRVSEAALEVGFESPAHFTREFKRRFGVAPSRSLELVATTRAGS